MHTLCTPQLVSKEEKMMTCSLAQSPTAIPVLSSVKQCVKFYSDCLTTRQRCGLGRHAVARDR